MASNGSVPVPATRDSTVWAYMASKPPSADVGHRGGLGLTLNCAGRGNGNGAGAALHMRGRFGPMATARKGERLLRNRTMARSSKPSCVGNSHRECGSMESRIEVERVGSGEPAACMMARGFSGRVARKKRERDGGRRSRRDRSRIGCSRASAGEWDGRAQAIVIGFDERTTMVRPSARQWKTHELLLPCYGVEAIGALEKGWHGVRPARAMPPCFRKKRREKFAGADAFAGL